MSALLGAPPSLPVAIPPSTYEPEGDVVTNHDCGHFCCDERTDPLHDHFLRPTDCPRCSTADASLEAALAEHFYRAACHWAETDGEPVEALVRDRFLVAAQDAVGALGLSRSVKTKCLIHEGGEFASQFFTCTCGLDDFQVRRAGGAS